MATLAMFLQDRADLFDVADCRRRSFLRAKHVPRARRQHDGCDEPRLKIPHGGTQKAGGSAEPFCEALAGDSSPSIINWVLCDRNEGAGGPEAPLADQIRLTAGFKGDVDLPSLLSHLAISSECFAFRELNVALHALPRSELVSASRKPTGKATSFGRAQLQVQALLQGHLLPISRMRANQAFQALLM